MAHRHRPDRDAIDVDAGSPGLRARRNPRPGRRDDPATDPVPYSSWDDATHGPHPRPSWVISDLSAIDTELGVIKTGKEADVHLVERALPGIGPVSLLAAKRYREPERRMFHRDAGYQEGRRVRRSRETRAMARRTEFGRELLAGQWAAAEFAALSRLWQLTHARPCGPLVPYPVQLRGRELLLEFIGEDGGAAPRLAQLRPDPAALADLWAQVTAAMTLLAREGLAHGDLSAYNLLVHRGRVVLIDLPQVVDVVANPRGPEFLARDVRTITAWFRARGLPVDRTDEALLLDDLLGHLGVTAFGRL